MPPVSSGFEMELFEFVWGIGLLAAVTVGITLLTVWAKRKTFGIKPSEVVTADDSKPKKNGNGNPKSNGKMEADIARLVVLGELQLVEEKKQTAVLEAEDGDGCKKVHNKPSIEKDIKDTRGMVGAMWDKFKNWKPKNGDV